MQDLLRRADRTAAGLAAGAAVPLPVTHPAEAVVTLLAAQQADAVPVVAAASWPADGLARALQLGDGLRGPDGAAPLVVVTSGSSGHPRAVVRTPGSWHVSLPAFDQLLEADCPRGATMWVPGSADSTLTLFGIWHALATGRPVVAGGRWRGASSVPAGSAARAVHCVPSVLADILTARASGEVPRLLRAVVAGSALPPGLRRAAADLGVRVTEYYGAAELSFVAADLDGSGLRPFPGVEVSVRDGLIWSRSPYQALGYLDPGAGGPLQHDAQGWACVGDAGTMVPGPPTGAGPVLEVRGRGDRSASVGGRVVVLDDVERALSGAPGVAEVVCFAEPDPRLGERVLCVVRPRPAGLAPPVRLLREAARAALPAHARPVRYVVRPDLPRTPGGKVALHTLRTELGLG